LPIKVILDTNFLMVPAQFRVDIFSGLEALLNQKIEPIILSSTYSELQKIISKHLKEGKAAKMALQLINKFSVVKAEPYVNETEDDLIVRYAKKFKCPVATNDKELRKKLRSLNIPVIYLRQKRRLELDGKVL
jgi:rRNA-processing protein FCF1